MTVSNQYYPEIDRFVIDACSQEFSTGPGAQTCTYCPPEAGSICDETGTTTILDISDNGGYMVRPIL